MLNEKDVTLKEEEVVALSDETIVKKESVHYNRLFPATLSTSSFMQLYILFLFEHRSTYYGKELIDEIETRLGSKWRPSHGMVYPMLRDLESKGLLTAEWEDPDKKTRRIYKITPLGRETLTQELGLKKNMFVDSYNMMVDVLGELYGVTRPRLLNVK